MPAKPRSPVIKVTQSPKRHVAARRVAEDIARSAVEHAVTVACEKAVQKRYEEVRRVAASLVETAMNKACHVNPNPNHTPSTCTDRLTPSQACGNAIADKLARKAILDAQQSAMERFTTMGPCETLQPQQRQLTLIPTRVVDPMRCPKLSTAMPLPAPQETLQAPQSNLALSGSPNNVLALPALMGPLSPALPPVPKPARLAVALPEPTTALESPATPHGDMQPACMTICLPSLDAALGRPIAVDKDPAPCLTLCIPSPALHPRWGAKSLVTEVTKSKLETTVAQLSQTAMEDALSLIEREDALEADSGDDWCDIQARHFTLLLAVWPSPLNPRCACS